MFLSVLLSAANPLAVDHAEAAAARDVLKKLMLISKYLWVSVKGMLDSHVALATESGFQNVGF